LFVGSVIYVSKKIIKIYNNFVININQKIKYNKTIKNKGLKSFPLIHKYIGLKIKLIK